MHCRRGKYAPTADSKTALYQIALGSDRPITGIFNSLLVDLSGQWFKRQAKIVAALHTQARDLKIVGEALREKEQVQAQLAQVIKRQAGVLKTTGQALQAKDKLIAALTEQLRLKRR